MCTRWALGENWVRIDISFLLGLIIIYSYMYIMGKRPCVVCECDDPNSLQWRHNERGGVLNPRRLDCLLIRLCFMSSSKFVSLIPDPVRLEMYRMINIYAAMKFWNMKSLPHNVLFDMMSTIEAVTPSSSWPWHNDRGHTNCLDDVMNCTWIWRHKSN